MVWFGPRHFSNNMHRPWGEDTTEEGVYRNTSFAHHGMKGTDLPELPTGVEWKIGGEAEVSWNIAFNHGGGYSYRSVNHFERAITYSAYT